MICIQPAKDWETTALSTIIGLGLSGPQSVHVQSDRYPFDLQVKRNYHSAILKKLPSYKKPQRKFKTY